MDALRARTFYRHDRADIETKFHEPTRNWASSGRVFAFGVGRLDLLGKKHSIKGFIYRAGFRVQYLQWWTNQK